jgi:hypothetical protein
VEKATFEGLETMLFHQQITMLLLPIIPKMMPSFLVESAVVFSLQTQHLLTVTTECLM